MNGVWIGSTTDHIKILGILKTFRKNNILQFHTDLRSPKVDILKNNNNASLVFYDKEEKIQLRVKVECEINNQNTFKVNFRLLVTWVPARAVSRR